MRYTRKKALDPKQCVLTPLAVEVKWQTERVCSLRLRIDAVPSGTEYSRLLKVELRAAETERRRADDALLAATTKFRQKYVNKYRGSDVDEEDLQNAAMLAIWRAALSWSESGGAPFDTWARYGVRGALQQVVFAARTVKASGRGEVVPLDETVRASGGTSEALPDPIARYLEENHGKRKPVLCPARLDELATELRAVGDERWQMVADTARRVARVRLLDVLKRGGNHG